MGRYGLCTRIVMIFLGVIWSGVGAFWLFHLDPIRMFDPGRMFDHDIRVLVFPLALLCGGLGLLKTGFTPDPPKTFEDEIPDAHPYLGQDDWLDWDD